MEKEAQPGYLNWRNYIEPIQAKLFLNIPPFKRLWTLPALRFYSRLEAYFLFFLLFRTVSVSTNVVVCMGIDKMLHLTLRGKAMSLPSQSSEPESYKRWSDSGFVYRGLNNSGPGILALTPPRGFDRKQGCYALIRGIDSPNDPFCLTQTSLEDPLDSENVLQVMVSHFTRKV